MEQHQTGPFVMRGTCRKCGGSGKIITDPCDTCEGKGLTRQMKSVAIAVPAGIMNDQTIRVTIGNSEVFVSVRVLESENFRREGDNILWF